MLFSGKKSKPHLISIMARTYDIDEIDGALAFHSKASNAVQLQVTKPLDMERYGKVTVDGVEISRGIQFDLPQAPIPFLMLPVGEVALQYDRTYTVRVEGFYDLDGNRMKDTTFRFKTKPMPIADPKYAAHDAVALEAAREGMVLLKNEDDILPLKADSILNIFGAAQNMFRLTAWGAGLIKPRYKPSFIQAIREHSSFTLNEELRELYAYRQERVPSKDVTERAKAKNDTAIIMITRGSGENLDNRPIKGEYYLTDMEREMIAAVTSVFDKTVLIINTGYPIDMRWTKEFSIKSILYTGFSGMLGAYALTELLDGSTNPSGKLPDTWSWDYFDAPASRNFINFEDGEKVPWDYQKAVKLYYEEDIYVGYRYFDTFRKDAVFGFGHGLSYTDFEVACDASSYDGKKLTLGIIVTNTGKVAGKEVVQVYIHAPDGKFEKPKRVLVAFEKTKPLAAGESQRFQIEIENKRFESYDPENANWILEQGQYSVYCGNSLSTSKQVFGFEFTETQILKSCKPCGVPVEKIELLTKANKEVPGRKSLIFEYEETFGKHGKKIPYDKPQLPIYTGKKITFEMLKKDHSLLNAFIAQMTNEELCRLSVCGGVEWMPWQAGTAGRVVPLKKYKLPPFVVSDGNAGVNIKKPNIGFPSSVTVCATFNRDIAYSVGKIIAEESIENGISLNLGPAMNIHRNILNGRHPEYFSEDPYLAGTMAGHQGKGLEDNGVSCCYKHFCCNNSETVRKASESIVSERALREIYFKVFEYAFDVHKPDAIMTSYNSVNGVYPAENPELLNDLLREEFGFEGFYMSDWDTYDTVEVVGMVAAGNCFITPGGKNDKHVKPLIKAVKEKRLSRGVLEDNIRYIVRVILKRVH